MENSTEDSRINLQTLNREEVVRQIPLILFLAVIGITGTFGNSLVCYVYLKKYSSSNYRTFIIVLSIVDVFICAVVIPFEILTLFREYNFKRTWLCKLSVFLNTWPTLTAGFLLLAIAIDRYRRVCKPLSWQISHNAAKGMCLTSGMIGVAFSWISPVIYGVQLSTHKDYNIIISECVETDAMKLTVFPVLNSIIFTVLFVGSLTGIIVMYCVIAIRVKQHVDRKIAFFPKRTTYVVNDDDVNDDDVNEMSIMSGKVTIRKEDKSPDNVASNSIFRRSDSSNSENEILEAEKTSLDLCSVDADVKCEDKNVSRKSILSRMISFGRNSLSLSKSLSTSMQYSVEPNDQMKAEAQRQKHRTAFIMFLISFAFIVSYLPLLCLLLIRTADSKFVSSLNDTERTIYKFCLRSYFINSAVNPFIYGLWDSRFRKSCKNIICKWKR